MPCGLAEYMQLYDGIKKYITFDEDTGDMIAVSPEAPEKIKKYYNESLKEINDGNSLIRVD